MTRKPIRSSISAGVRAALCRTHPRGGSLRNPGGTVRWTSVRQELRQLVEDQGRLVGDDRLGLVGAVAAPEREPDQVVVLGHRHVGEPVEPVLDPLERAGRDVVFEVRVVVTRRSSPASP